MPSNTYRTGTDARNAGIKASTGDLVIFTDDDCFVAGTWLTEILSKYRENPDLAGAGGRVELYDERDLPITVRTSLDPAVATVQNIFSLIPGCNMSFRRSTFAEVGLFDGAFGAGTRLRSAEDSDFIYRVLKAGLRVEYFPSITVFHAHGRRTAEQAQRLSRNYVIGRGSFYFKHALSRDKPILKQAYWELRDLTRKAFRSSEKRRSLALIWQLFYGMALYLPVHLRRVLSRRQALDQAA